MDKFLIFKNIEDKEERMFLSFVYDKIFSSYEKGYPAFADFCSPAQLAILNPIVSKELDGCDFLAKIKNSERKIPAVNYEYSELPTDIIAVSGCGDGSITHRDVLGSLMSLGIKRPKIGDIVIADKVYFEVKKEISAYILSNLSKIRNRSVNLEIYDGKLERSFSFEEIPLTVSSLRADCIIGGIAKLSRENAKNYILSGRVSVNSLIFDNPSKQLNEGDIISVRRTGKFVFEKIAGLTKKDRIKIIIKKYI